MWGVRIPYFLLKALARCNAMYTDKTQGHLPLVFNPYEVRTMWKGHQYSNMKAKQMLGWNPRVPMDQALASTYSSLSSSLSSKSI